MRQYPIISLLVMCSLSGCGAGSADQLAVDEIQNEIHHSATVTGATIQRSGDNFTLGWTTDGNVDKVRIYEGTDPDDLDDLIATVQNVNTKLITGLAPGLRHYFRIKGGSGNGIVIGERGLPQANVVNLRDIGGYTSRLHNKDKYVAWGKFFRSGFIQPSVNQTFLATLGIRTVVDLRNSVEIAAGGPQNVAGANILSAPIYDADALGVDPVSPHFCFPGNQTPACYAAQEAFFGPNGENLRALKVAGFRAFITGIGPHPFNFGQTPRDAIRILLQTLADKNQLPLVWADTGGEFRVGFGAAVTELLLGVSDADVLADYALTTEFRQAVSAAQINQLVNSGLVKKAEYITAQFVSNPEAMQGFLDQLYANYGTVTNYVHSLGITDCQIEQIRENLLRN